MKNPCLEDQDPRQLGPLTLAFVGDAVFELLVRGRLVRRGDRPVSELHRLSVREVCCGAQARAAQTLLPLLTEDEKEVLRRGRNAHPGHVPKNADNAEYHAATGLEAVFGYLYLRGGLERLRALYGALGGQAVGEGGNEDAAGPQE